MSKLQYERNCKLFICGGICGFRRTYLSPKEFYGPNLKGFLECDDERNKFCKYRRKKYNIKLKNPEDEILFFGGADI